MDLFSQGFVEILAAEQTPDNPNWFQGTADAVRQAARHFARHDADYYLILAGDHLYRMDYARAGRRAHRSPGRHHDRRAAGRRRTTRRRWASSASIATGQIVAFEEKPNAARLAEIGQSIPRGRDVRRRTSPDKPFVASMGIYVFSRDVLLDVLAAGRRDGLRPRDHSARARPLPRATRTCSAATGPTSARSQSFYDANIMLTRAGRAVQLLRSAPADLHAPALSAGLAPERLHGARRDRRRRLLPRSLHDRAVDHRHPHQRPGRARASARSVLLGADFYEADDEAPARGERPRLGIGRDVVLDRVIVDKNARIGDGVQPGQRGRRPGRRRRRLLHPQRHHHRAEGRRDHGRDAGLGTCGHYASLAAPSLRSPRAVELTHAVNTLVTRHTHHTPLIRFPDDSVSASPGRHDDCSQVADGICFSSRCVAATAFAQTDQGRFTGTVRDPVERVRRRARPSRSRTSGPAKSATALTNQQGYFLVGIAEAIHLHDPRREERASRRSNTRTCRSPSARS